MSRDKTRVKPSTAPDESRWLHDGGAGHERAVGGGRDAAGDVAEEKGGK